MKTIGIIPARYGSTRLPGKPLLEIAGKPMLYWVYQRTKEIENIEEIIVATDHPKISAICEKYGMPYIMTDSSHQTAANRLWEVSERVRADFYVQINGDEPLINVNAISAAVPCTVPQNIEFGTNIVTKITDTMQLMSPSNIKVVFDSEMRMRYMSRTPIPYPYKQINYTYYKHVGIIGYNKMMLDFYHNSKPGNLEQVEGIDTLRFIDYGKELMAVVFDDLHSFSVDTYGDLEQIRRQWDERSY